MSLINKVLKDLETRERTMGEHQDVPALEDLRSAPESAAARGPLFAKTGLLVVGLVLALGAGAYLYIVRPASPAKTQKAAPTSALKPTTAVAVPVVALPTPPPAVPAIVHGAPSPSPLSRGPMARPVAAPRARARVAHALPVKPRPRPMVRKARAHADGRITRHAVPLTPALKAQNDYRLAIAALQDGHGAAARGLLRAALAQSPGLVHPTLLLAALLVQDGDSAGAGQILTVAMAHHPKTLSLAMLMAQVDLRTAQPGAAAQVLSSHRASGAGRADYWALLGAAQERAGQEGQALVSYQEGIRRFPHNGPLWVGLGLTLTRAGHAHAAQKAYTEAKRFNLSPVLAHFVAQQLGALSGAGP